MRPVLLLTLALASIGCGESPSPVIDYLDAVEVELGSDGREAFVYLRPKATPATGCPRFGAPATVDGAEMVAFQFGGETRGWFVASESPRCDSGAYRVPFMRSAESKVSKVRIADSSGEITFSAVDALTEPVLVWEGASELPARGFAELRVMPESLSFKNNQSLSISVFEGGSDRQFRASASGHGSRLTFVVPLEAPPGPGQIRVDYNWTAQLSAVVLDCKGATSCTAGSRFAESARTPITVLPP
jgi:hypothetical protein